VRLRPVLSIVALASLLGATGCASTLHGTTQKIGISSTPPGATALVLPEGTTLTTPATIELQRKLVHTVLIELANYCPQRIYVDRIVSDALMGNVAVGGVIGLTVDMANGAAFYLVPERIDVELQPVPPGGCE
jgi:hypothetical protein